MNNTTAETNRRSSTRYSSFQLSGYDQKFQTEVIRSALHTCNRLTELDASGEKPSYRLRGWRRLERTQENRMSRETWYRKGDLSTVIFVPATPRSQLKHRYMKEIKETGFKDSLSTTMQRAPRRRFRGPRNPKVLRRHLKTVEICLHLSHPSVEWIEIFLWSYEIYQRIYQENYQGIKTERN